MCLFLVLSIHFLVFLRVNSGIYMNTYGYLSTLTHSAWDSWISRRSDLIVASAQCIGHILALDLTLYKISKLTGM